MIIFIDSASAVHWLSVWGSHNGFGGRAPVLLDSCKNLER